MSWRSMAVAVFLFGCGARTELELARLDGGPDARASACLRDSECDDRIPCTVDRCVAGRCSQTASDPSCATDSFCAGPGRCDAAIGCVYDRAPCMPRLACLETTCDEVRDQCVETPNNALCPVSQRCDREEGCVARALVHDSQALYEVNLPSGRVRFLLRANVGLTDVALYPDGRVVGVVDREFLSIDESTGLIRSIGPSPNAFVALEVGPDGELYTAGDSRGIYRVDPPGGRGEAVAWFPEGWQASGDIAFVSSRMLITAIDEAGLASAGPDSLFEAPLDGGDARRIGSIGFACVWGLAAFGTTLYGFTCDGRLLLIDPSTGRGERIATMPELRAGGAAAR